MKFLFFISYLVVLFTLRVSAQRVISSSDAGKHIGERVTVCDTVVGVTMNRNANTTTIELGGQYNDQRFIVVCGSGDTSDFKESFVRFVTGQRICLTGKVKEINGRAAIEISDPELITVRKVGLLGNGNTVKRHRITNVALAPPPGAHHFGEGYKAVSLAEIDKAGTDTVKITDTICSCRQTNKMSLICFGRAYPNQKFTIVLKGMAKEYLDAILKMQYKSSNSLLVLNGKKLMCIGKVTRFNKKPQMVISNPNLFVIIK